MCRNCSIVDYVLVSVNVFEILEDFDISVYGFCNFLVDVIYNLVFFFLFICYLLRNIFIGKNYLGVKLWCFDKVD